MGSINLYKIDDSKIDSFRNALKEKLSPQDEHIIYTDKEGTIKFEFALYTKCENSKRAIKWNWLLNTFGMASITLATSPQAILLVQNEKGSLYAITYGHSFFFGGQVL